MAAAPHPKDTIKALQSLVLPLILFSLVTNMTVLVSPLFMMQVLDRVVPSGNLATLIMLLTIAWIVLMANGAIEYYRDVALGSSTGWLGNTLTSSILKSAAKDRFERILDVQRLSGFLEGGGAVNLLNLPIVPLFLAVLFIIHPAFLAIAAFSGSLVLVLKYLRNFVSKRQQAEQDQASAQSHQLISDLQSQQRLAGLMSIGVNLLTRLEGAQSRLMWAKAGLNKKEKALAATGGTLRSATQIGALACGAALVTTGDLTPGGMIGVSIIMAKTIGGIEGIAAAAGSLSAMFTSYKNLCNFRMLAPLIHAAVNDLGSGITAENLIHPKGRGAMPRLDKISFDVKPGECLAILGESGSGKTTLLHALSGCDPAPIGTVRLDDTDVRTLPFELRDRSIGYLPQRASLMSGSIAENIACFSPDQNDDQVIAAARLAGVHGFISSLPNAYATDQSQEPDALSEGQIQRVALARAIYHQPKLLFLDEPNALLDAHGEKQLGDALRRLKSNGCTIVMVIHRAGIIGVADKVLILDRGRIADSGPRTEVLMRNSNTQRQLRLPINAAATNDLTDWVAGQFHRAGDAEFCARSVQVAVELYNFARKNGPNSANRQLTFSIEFQSDTTCTLKLSEPRRTSLTRKINKIRSRVNAPSKDFLDFESDEMVLAMVMQLSKDFRLNSGSKSSEYAVTLEARDSENLGLRH